METISNFSGRWLEIVTAVFLIAMTLYGHHKGFIRLVVSAAAMLITLFAVRFATPYVTDWLKNDTPVYENVKQGLADAINLEDRIAALGGDMSAEKSQERLVIENLELPEQVKQILVENNNGEIYELLGVERFEDYIVGYLADAAIRIVVFVSLFIIVFIVLHVAVIWMDLIARLPIISGLNKIAGAVLGLVEGLVFVWIACLVFTAISGTGLGNTILERVSTSPWLCWIYNHNMLSYFIIGLVRTML